MKEGCIVVAYRFKTSLTVVGTSQKTGAEQTLCTFMVHVQSWCL